MSRGPVEEQAQPYGASGKCVSQRSAPCRTPAQLRPQSSSPREDLWPDGPRRGVSGLCGREVQPLSSSSGSPGFLPLPPFAL